MERGSWPSWCSPGRLRAESAIRDVRVSQTAMGEALPDGRVRSKIDLVDEPEV